jgi:hypothetical protein
MRFSVGPGPDLTITKHPTTTLMKLAYGDDPHLASDGKTVALAYYDRPDVRARISQNHGRTFEPRQIIWDEPFRGEIAAAPESVDVRWGHFSRWTATPSIGEAWDNAYLSPAPLHQKLRFHSGPI